MTEKKKELYGIAAELMAVSPLAAELVRDVGDRAAEFEALVEAARVALAALGPEYRASVWLNALGRELWATIERHGDRPIDGVYVARDGAVYVRPKQGEKQG